MEQNSVGTIKPNHLHTEPNSKSNYLKYTSINAEPSISQDHKNQFPQPSSKLEQIEKFLLDTKSCDLCATTPITSNSNSKSKAKISSSNLHNSSGIINISNPNSVLTSHNCCNKILANLSLFDEPKIFSLQRSISEKLRNSLKSTTHNIHLLNSSNINNNQVVAKDISSGHLRIPRKWHSERCRVSSTALNNTTKPPSSRFSTQVPLNNHYKAILAQYTNKAKLEQQQNQQNSEQHKSNNTISKLNKKFSHITINKKRSSQSSEMNNQQVQYPYIESYRKTEDYPDNSSTSPLSSDSEQDENNSHLNNKDKRKINYLRMLKYQEKFSHADDSNETDLDTEDDATEAANFDHNSRIDFRERYVNNIDDIEVLGVDTIANTTIASVALSEKSAFEHVTSEQSECTVCCENGPLNERKCCQYKVCNSCVNTYIQTQIKQCCGQIQIECLNSKCTKLIHRDEINERMKKLDKDALKIYLKFLIDANKDSNCKTCPRCSHVMSITNFAEIKKRPTKSKLKFNSAPKLTKVQCNECQLVWCFQCHAPWHDGITCNEFRKGDRMLKYWASEVHYGQQNAQLCPKCKIYIQRTNGCDHMVCTFCQTDFCYKCGCRFRTFKFLGDHYSKLSVLGCKYRFYPQKPAKRRVIRGSVLCGKVLAMPLLATAGLVIGVGALVVGCIAIPTYGSYRLIKHIQLKTNQNQNSVPSTVNFKTSNYQNVKLSNPKDSEILTEPGLLLTTSSSLPKTSVSEANGTTTNLIPREATTDPKFS